MHHRANLYGLHISFAQRVECKVGFVIDALDGVINQFVDMRAKDFREMEVTHWLPQAQKDFPPICCFLTRIADALPLR